MTPRLPRPTRVAHALSQRPRRFPRTALLALATLALAGCGTGLAPEPHADRPSAARPPANLDHLPPADERAVAARVARRNAAAATQAAAPTVDFTATVVAASTPEVLATSESPDGAWRVEVVRHPCASVDSRNENDPDVALEVLWLLDARSGERRLIDEQLLVCDDALGAFRLAALFWSPSSRFLYYTHAREGAPEGCGGWVRPIHVVEGASGRRGSVGDRAMVSPDRSRIAAWQERHLVVRDVDDGEEIRFVALDPDPELKPDQIAWSPSGSRLAYLQRTWDCDAKGRSVVALVDLVQGRQEVLVADDESAIDAVSWIANARLQLDTFGGQRSFIDLRPDPDPSKRVAANARGAALSPTPRPCPTRSVPEPLPTSTAYGPNDVLNDLMVTGLGWENLPGAAVIVSATVGAIVSRTATLYAFPTLEPWPDGWSPTAEPPSPTYTLWQANTVEEVFKGGERVSVGDTLWIPYDDQPRDDRRGSDSAMWGAVALGKPGERYLFLLDDLPDPNPGLAPYLVYEEPRPPGLAFDLRGLGATGRLIVTYDRVRYSDSGQLRTEFARDMTGCAFLERLREEIRRAEGER